MKGFLKRFLVGDELFEECDEIISKSCLRDFSEERSKNAL